MTIPTSNVQLPCLDHRFYPHIIDNILSQTPWSALPTWRQTSSVFRDRVDAIMFKHVVISMHWEPAEHVDTGNSIAVHGGALSDGTALSDGRVLVVRVRAPGGRPLPYVYWNHYNPHGTDDPRHDKARRMLACTRIVDWDIKLPEHRYIRDGEEEEEDEARAAAIAPFAPLTALLCNVQVVRRHNATPCDIKADTYIDFVYVTSCNGQPKQPWWGGFPHFAHLTAVPAGTRKHVIDVRYDPKHINLDFAYWSHYSTAACVKSVDVREIVIIFSKEKAIRFPLSRIQGDPPTNEYNPLGFVGDVITTATVALWRGGKLTLVGIDHVPSMAMKLDPTLDEAEREHAIKSLVRDIVNEWPAHLEWYPQARETLNDPQWTDASLERALSSITYPSADEYAAVSGSDHHLAAHPPKFHQVSNDCRDGKLVRWDDAMEQSEEAEVYQDSDTEYLRGDESDTSENEDDNNNDGSRPDTSHAVYNPSYDLGDDESDIDPLYITAFEGET